MRGSITQFSAIAASEEKWKPLVHRLEAQVDEACGLQHGISDMYGPCIAINFLLDGVWHTIYPDQNVLFVGDVEKVIELEVSDDWVHVRLKIAQAPLRLDGPPPEPGPELVQWLRQQMSSSSQIEGVTDSDWTFERCIKEAASHLMAPPLQTSPHLPVDHALLDAASGRALPPGDAEALKLRLTEFGLAEPDAFTDLFPFIQWAASQSDQIEEELYQFLFDWAGATRESLLRNWGVTPRNEDAISEAALMAGQIRIGASMALSRWTHGDSHTAEMVKEVRDHIQNLSELREKVRAI